MNYREAMASPWKKEWEMEIDNQHTRFEKNSVYCCEPKFHPQRCEAMQHNLGNEEEIQWQIA